MMFYIISASKGGAMLYLPGDHHAPLQEFDTAILVTKHRTALLGH